MEVNVIRIIKKYDALVWMTDFFCPRKSRRKIVERKYVEKK
jgi:hypothetical protein